MLTEGWEDSWIGADSDGRLGLFHCGRTGLRPAAALSLFHAGERSRRLSHALYEQWLKSDAPLLVFESNDTLWFDGEAARYFLALKEPAHATPFIQAGVGRWWDESKCVLDVTGLASQHAEAIDAHLEELQERDARPHILNVTEDGAEVSWPRVVAHFKDLREDPSVYVLDRERGTRGVPSGAWVRIGDLPLDLRPSVVRLAKDFRSDLRMTLPDGIVHAPPDPRS